MVNLGASKGFRTLPMSMLLYSFWISSLIVIILKFSNGTLLAGTRLLLSC